jgi:hypothetical protein
VITEAGAVLAGHAEQSIPLGVDEGAGRAADTGDVRGHDEPPGRTHAPCAEESKSAGPLLVGKRDEGDLLDWLGTEVGFLSGVARYNEEPLLFEPYQIAFLESKSRFRWIEKSRQIGYSFLFACEAVARCHLRDAHTAVMLSYNLEDAKEKVNYARQLAEELPLAYRKRLVADSKTELGFLSNGAAKRVSRILSLPSKAPRGRRGDVYLDELAHYANDREVYKGSTALIVRSSGQLTGCSSPLGRRGVFWETARQATSVRAADGEAAAPTSNVGQGKHGQGKPKQRRSGQAHRTTPGGSNVGQAAAPGQATSVRAAPGQGRPPEHGQAAAPGQATSVRAAPARQPPRASNVGQGGPPARQPPRAAQATSVRASNDERAPADEPGLGRHAGRSAVRRGG